MALSLILLAGVFTATEPTAAATAPVTVTVTVPSATSVDASGCRTGAVGITDLGTVLPGASVASTSSCVVVFGSSNDSSMLQLVQRDGVGTAMLKLGPAPDPTFASGGKRVSSILTDGYLHQTGIALQPDGKIVVGGRYNVGATKYFAAERYNTDGSLDGTFGAGGLATVVDPSGGTEGYAVAIQPDGKVVVAGYDQNGSQEGVARFSSTGVADATWGTGGVQQYASFYPVTSVVPLAGGQLLLGGFNNPGKPFTVIRTQATGPIDATFGAGGYAFVPAAGNSAYVDHIAVQTSGKIVAVGYDGGTAVARFTAAGVLDATFAGGGYFVTPTCGESYGMAMQPDDSFVTAGWDCNNNISAWRYTANGAPDATFGTAGYASLPFPGGGQQVGLAVAIQADGRIVVGGHLEVPTSYWSSLVRFTSTGAVDTTFGDEGLIETPPVIPDGDDEIGGLVIQADGKLVALHEDDSMGAENLVVVRYDLSSSTSVPDYQGGSATWGGAGQNLFGACLQSVAGGAVTGGSNWTATGSCTTNDADPWHAIAVDGAAPGAKVTGTGVTGTTNMTANIAFGYRASPTQPAGNYQAQLLFQVVAPYV